MLPRKLRLSRSGFEAARGLRRASSAHFSVSYTDHAALAGCAVVVSKKVAKSAVQRHLMKRRIRPLLLPFAGGTRAIIVHALPGSAELPPSALRDELTTLLRSILSAHS